MKDLESYIIDTKDFPKKGVTFKDVSPLLKENFRETISSFAALFDKETLDKVDYIAGIDSRGFIFGSALAQYLGKGFVMIRKGGKLPPPTVSERYSLEYGTAEIEMSSGSGGVIIVDDVLATGGTLTAAAKLCKRAGYDVLDIAVLLDLKFLNDFSWQNLKAKSLIQYRGNDDILIVMALKDECQGYFAKENVIYTGIGKTNAAYALMKAINKKKPKLVVNLGSSGSAIFNKGELINCTEFIQRDMDARDLGCEQYVTPFDKMDEQILSYGNVIEGLKKGICGTGDNFDSSANKSAAYNLVDMESYALAKICKLQNIPFTCVKYITDGADGGAAKDWNQALNMAAKELFECYMQNIAVKYDESLAQMQRSRPKVHLCLFNIHHIDYVVDQVEFILAVFKQNNYQITVGNDFKDDALNFLIECFDESSDKDVKKIISYCEKNNKKVAVIMTEHIDYFDKKIYAYSVPLDEIDNSHYNPCIKQRILSLLTISPYIKHIFTLGEYPKLNNFKDMIGKTPIAIPYPKIEEVESQEDSEYDFIFSGKDTSYRSQVMEEIKEMSLSLSNNSYQKILKRRKRNKLISEAKINLNIPQDEKWLYPSTLRIILALSLGKMTISIGGGDKKCEGEDFYAKVDLSNLSELESYLKNPDLYYKKFLKRYNEIASNGSFPREHFLIWGEIEGAIK